MVKTKLSCHSNYNLLYSIYLLYTSAAFKMNFRLTPSPKRMNLCFHHYCPKENWSIQLPNSHPFLLPWGCGKTQLRPQALDLPNPCRWKAERYVVLQPNFCSVNSRDLLASSWRYNTKPFSIPKATINHFPGNQSSTLLLQPAQRTGQSETAHCEWGHRHTSNPAPQPQLGGLLLRPLSSIWGTLLCF